MLVCCRRFAATEAVAIGRRAQADVVDDLSLSIVATPTEMARVNVVVVDGPRALEARSTRTELKRASGVILTDLAAERNALNNAVTVDEVSL